MKKALLILLIFTVVTIGCHNDHNAISINTTNLSLSLKSIYDTTSVLERFFSPVKITNKNIAVWKPTMDDYFNMAISEDSMCRTRVDTIINLKNQTYIILFRTDGYRNNDIKNTCHICSPIYSIATIKKEDSTYTILNFKKNLIAAGSFGSGYDTLKVENFGTGFQLLRFSSSYTGTSTETFTNTYFEINEYQQVFSYWPYRSEGDSTEHGSYYTKIEQQLIHITGKEFKDRDDIKLQGYFTNYDERLKKIIRKSQTEYYRADAFGNYKRTLQ